MENDVGGVNLRVALSDANSPKRKHDDDEKICGSGLRKRPRLTCCEDPKIVVASLESIIEGLRHDLQKSEESKTALEEGLAEAHRFKAGLQEDLAIARGNLRESEASNLALQNDLEKVRRSKDDMDAEFQAQSDNLKGLVSALEKSCEEKTALRNEFQDTMTALRESETRLDEAHGARNSSREATTEPEEQPRSTILAPTGNPPTSIPYDDDPDMQWNILPFKDVFGVGWGNVDTGDHFWDTLDFDLFCGLGEQESSTEFNKGGF
jgi:hypothetical protein